MRKLTALCLGTLLCASLGTLSAAAPESDPPGVIRKELQRWEVPGSNYVVITTLTEMQPGASAPFHTHYGVEMGYVLQGESVLSVKGMPDMHHKAGDSFMVPPGAVHSGHNTGSVPAKMVTTFIVEKDKPLRTPAK